MTGRREVARHRGGGLAGSRMLANHADLCPYTEAGQITEVRVEPTLAVHDTDANVIVIAKPDMLYMEDGAWVYREIKTRQRPLRSSVRTCSGDFPQLALATVLMAENALGGQAGRRSHRAGAAHPRHRRCAAYRPQRPGRGRHGPDGRPRARRTVAFRQGGCGQAREALPAARSAAGARTLRREERHDNPGRKRHSSRRHGAACDTVATAIVVLSRRQAPGDPVYEDRVQRAYNHLVLHCMHGGAEPPASVPAHDRLGRPDAASGVAC